jgi:hypothetical protein
VDLGLGHFRVLEDFLHGGNGVLEEWHAEFFEFGSGEGKVEVFGLGEGVDLDGGLSGGRENSLGSFALGSESSHGSGVLSDVDSFLFHEVGGAEFDEFVVEIFSSEMVVSGGGFDLEDSVVDGEEGYIKSTTTQIENEDVSLSLSFFVQTVSNSGGGWLVDDSQDVDSGNSSGVFSGLFLLVVEISWHGDDGVFDFLSDVGFGDFLHFDEHH